MTQRLKKPPLVVVTSTMHDPHDHRFGLALKTAHLATQLGLPLVVVDASRHNFIAAAMRQAGAQVFAQTTTGMGNQRREAVNHARRLAGKNGVILWIEPEKYDLLYHAKLIAFPIWGGSAGIVVPRRSPRSWETYPDFQKVSELRANAAYCEGSGLPGMDPLFGPVAFAAKYAHFYTSYRAEEYGLSDRWDAMHIPTLVAYANGVTVASVETDFIYPPDQCRLELFDRAIRQKRRVQEEELSRGYRHACQLLGLPKK